MATRQGITAHLTQSADDARRTIINSAMPTSILLSHRWFSNMNTTCTIKSAPPRTPEVMTLLSTRSGWLQKRNEQGVWQRRYCCVVPHTFLYYFDSGPVDGGGGVGGPGGAHSSSSGGGGGGYHTNGGEDSASGEALARQAAAAAAAAHNRDGGGGGGDAAAPVGIIDLECYSQIDRVAGPDGDGGTGGGGGGASSARGRHRRGASGASREQTNTMELTGDSITNPDLRSFYFRGDDAEECEAWTTALLSDRHQALRDEREAYRQVCESFPIQLAEMSRLVDEAEGKAGERESEAYQVRSSAEEGRKMIIELVRESVERLGSGGGGGSGGTGSAPGTPSLRRTGSNGSAGSLKENGSGSSNGSLPGGGNGNNDALRSGLRAHRSNFLSQLDAVLSQSHHRILGGAPESVSILVNVIDALVSDLADVHSNLSRTECELRKRQSVTKSEFVDLEQQLATQRSGFARRERGHLDRIGELESTVHALSKDKTDLEQMLSTTTMETSIQNKTAKAKLKELVEHRRILKKEVIDLRSSVENTKSEMDVLRHQKTVLEQKYRDERRRRVGLEENYGSLREQLSVQERVWGMMQTSLASVAGGSVAPGMGSVAPTPEKDDGEEEGEGGDAHPVVPNLNELLNAAAMANDAASPSVVYGKRTSFHPRDVVVKKRIMDSSRGAGGEADGGDDGDGDDSQRSGGDTSGGEHSRTSGVSLADSALEDDSSTCDNSSTNTATDDDDDDDGDDGSTGGGGDGADGVMAGSGGGGAAPLLAPAIPPRHPNNKLPPHPPRGGRHSRGKSSGEISLDVDDAMSEITTDVGTVVAAATAATAASSSTVGIGDESSRRHERVHISSRRRRGSTGDDDDDDDDLDAPIVIEDDRHGRVRSRRSPPPVSAGGGIGGDELSPSRPPNEKQRQRAMRELRDLGIDTSTSEEKKRKKKTRTKKKGGGGRSSKSSRADRDDEDEDVDVDEIVRHNNGASSRVGEGGGGEARSRSETPNSVLAGAMCGIPGVAAGCQVDDVDDGGGNEEDDLSQLSQVSKGLRAVVECAAGGPAVSSSDTTTTADRGGNDRDDYVEEAGYRSDGDDDEEEEEGEGSLHLPNLDKQTEGKDHHGLTRKKNGGNSEANGDRDGAAVANGAERSSRRRRDKLSKIKSSRSKAAAAERARVADDTGGGAPPPPPPPPRPHSARRDDARKQHGRSASGGDAAAPGSASPYREQSKSHSNNLDGGVSVVSHKSYKSASSMKSGSYTITGVRTDASPSRKKLSLAERARLEAESPEFSQSVKVAPSPATTPSRPSSAKHIRSGGNGGSTPATPTRNADGGGSGGGGGRLRRTNSSGSFLSMLGPKLFDAIDNSVLGVKVPNEAGQQEQQPPPQTNDGDDDDAVAVAVAVAADQDGAQTTLSDASSMSRSTSGGSALHSQQPVPSTPPATRRRVPGGNNGDPRRVETQLEDEVMTPLHLRQQLQREKQLAFLKERGLLQ